MTLWLELRCSGPAQPSNGCPEGYGERGFGRAFVDSQHARKNGYAAVVADAERQGWKRNSKDRRMRCPACAAALETSMPVEIAGIAWANWDAALKRYEAGEFPSVWGGTDGLPTARQFRQAIHRYPEMLARVKASAIYTALPEEKAAPVDEARWSDVIERYEAGADKTSICTGRDGWPSVAQWNLRRKRDASFRARTEAVAKERTRGRAAVARAARGPAKPRVYTPRSVRLDPAVKAARAEARQAAVADRRRLAAEASELLKQYRLRQAAERAELRQAAVAERKRLDIEARNAARALKERDRLQRLAERKQERAARPKRRVRRPAPLFSMARRIKRRVDPPELKFERRLAPENAEGCRFFCGPVPGSVDIGGGKSMAPAKAALFFAGKAVPKGCVVEHTCWNDNCFAVDHLDATPREWRKPMPKMIGTEVLEHVAAIVSRQFGVERAELTATVERERGTKHVAFVRQVFRYLLSVELEFSHPMVAASTGCDRTTVQYGNNIIEDRRDDAAFDKLLDALAVRARAYDKNHQPTTAQAAKKSAIFT